MRRRVSKAERRKAMAIIKAHVSAKRREIIPEFINAGVFNCVYALSKDLVLRVQRRVELDSSWEVYEVAQLQPHSGLPTVWELGEFKGLRFGIIERMDCTLDSLVYSGAVGPFQDNLTLDEWVEHEIAPATEHVKVATGKDVRDMHPCNIMKRRKSKELVLTDCHLYC